MAFDIDMIKLVYSRLSERVAEARKLTGRSLTATEKILYSHLWESAEKRAFSRGVDIQEKQVETGTYNFERSEAQYKLGSITSIEFRQAQVNLRNAQNQWTLSKYEAKLAELSVLKLCGQLLNISL